MHTDVCSPSCLTVNEILLQGDKTLITMIFFFPSGQDDLLRVHGQNRSYQTDVKHTCTRTYTQQPVATVTALDSTAIISLLYDKNVMWLHVFECRDLAFKHKKHEFSGVNHEYFDTCSEYISKCVLKRCVVFK